MANEDMYKALLPSVWAAQGELPAEEGAGFLKDFVENARSMPKSAAFKKLTNDIKTFYDMPWFVRYIITILCTLGIYLLMQHWMIPQIMMLMNYFTSITWLVTTFVSWTNGLFGLSTTFVSWTNGLFGLVALVTKWHRTILLATSFVCARRVRYRTNLLYQRFWIKIA